MLSVLLDAAMNATIILGPIFVCSVLLSINEQRKLKAERLRLEEERKQKELQDYANRLYAQNSALQFYSRNNY